MIMSMTGYGGAKYADNQYELSVELKSVNNRYLDTSVRIPRSFMFAEDTIKSAVKSHITRGKVDVFVTISSTGADDIKVTVNDALVSEYKNAVEHIGNLLGVSTDITALQLSRYSDVLTLEKRDIDTEKITLMIENVINKALSEFDDMRAKEGDKLRLDILSKLESIEEKVFFIEKYSPKTVAEYRERLTKKMQEVLESTNIDESRILTEAAIFADKIAVDEETVRLHSHISQMREILSGDSPAGRKLEFIVQELNRETNTIGSKCNDNEITCVVLDMKSEIEKIREQVQNIE